MVISFRNKYVHRYMKLLLLVYSSFFSLVVSFKFFRIGLNLLGIFHRKASKKRKNRIIMQSEPASDRMAITKLVGESLTPATIIRT